MSDIYNESMSLACQAGLCEGCLSGRTWCSCICHIPDDDPVDEADAAAAAWYDHWHLGAERPS